MRGSGRFGIVVTERLWWSEAVKGWVKVFHFPPNRRPRVSRLRRGDVCIVYLSDAKSVVGEFTVEEVKLVSAEEFERYRGRAYEVPKAPFPRGGERSWVIVFEDLKPYVEEIPKRDIPKFSSWPIKGFTYVTERHHDVLDYVRRRGLREVASLEGARKSEHDQLIDLLCELGSMLSYDRVEGKFYEDGMEFDVVWWRRPRKYPTHVFEVQLRGNLYQALSKLKHAHDIWGSKVFLVAERDDIERARELVMGSFHEIKDKLTFIEPETVRQYYEFKKRFLKVQMELERLP